MIVTMSMVVAFEIPGEMEEAVKFENNNPKWGKDMDSRYWYFQKHDTWSAGAKNEA